MTLESPIVFADIGDGVKRAFLLRSDELREIKRATGRGFYTLYSNFAANAEPDEVAHVLRLGLIGGGMSPIEALQLTEYYARPPRPLKNIYVLAYEVLNACWAGVEPSKPSEEPVVAPTDKEIDEFFDRIEAGIAAAGGDTSVVRGKTYAEVRRLCDLADKENREREGAPAPSQEAFDAIKRSAEAMKS